GMGNDITTCVLWKKGWRINAKNEWYKPHITIPDTIQKPNLRNEPSRQDAREEKGAGCRVRMVITSYRVRLCDIDNLEVKFLVDALRYAKLILDDSPDHMSELSIRQIKVDHRID